MMNRKMMRASKKIGKSMMKLPASKFEEIPYYEIQQRSPERMKQMPDRVWKNNHYTVQLYRYDRDLLGHPVDRLMIRRNDAEPIRDWHELQSIKSQIIGKEKEAFQVFPKESELVDVANMYWLFTSTGNL